MTNGTFELYRKVEGPEGVPVLVMANSLGTSLGMWDAQVSDLARRFRLVRYDHRGHGRSPVPDGPYTIADLGRDVLAMADGMGVDRFSFCGLSIGGMVGMWVASEAPDRVERLVLCCTAARFDPPGAWEERAGKVRAGGMEAVAEAVIERWFTPPFFESHPEETRRARDMLLGTPPEGYAGCCEAIRDADLHGRLGGIRAPTLIIAGAEDPAAPPERAEEIRASVPDADLLVVEGAAHLANIEQPEAVTRAILDHVGGER